MEVTEFNDVFLQNILEKLCYDYVKIIIIGDFNIDILKYRVTPRPQTLIDNIFQNIIEEDIISGNITTTLSDHYIQFLLFKNKIKSQTNIKKANFGRNYKSLNKDFFEYDLRTQNEMKY